MGAVAEQAKGASAEGASQQDLWSLLSCPLCLHWH